MIAKQRHSETHNGKFVYVIEMPEAGKCNDHVHRELDREMFGVKFWNGQGRTTSRRKAQRFDEWYNYTVYLHKKDIPWENVTEDPVPTDDLEEEDHFYIDVEDLDENEETSS